MTRALVGGLVAALCTGCFSVRHAYDGPKILSADPAVGSLDAKVVRHFEVQDRQFFWIHGGIPVGEALNGAALAAAQIGEHDGVVNLRIREGQDLRDLVITHGLCVLTILCGEWSVWVEGDVVDFEEDAR